MKMEKKILLTLVLGMLLTSLSYSLTLADLDIEDRIVTEEFIIEMDDEITQANIEELEGIEFWIVYETDEYIIVIVSGKYVIVYK
jgi:hypothetical protein